MRKIYVLHENNEWTIHLQNSLERHGRIVVDGSTALRLEAMQDEYDVNTNTNYHSDAKKIAGQFAMLELAKYLAARLQES